MALTVREGSLAECVSLIDEISEFSRGETIESLNKRLRGLRSLVLVAEEEGRLLGFKIGYELNCKQFYSWLGGVNSSSRGKGVAQTLLDAQEQWAQKNAYSEIKVKTRNQFPAMARLLFRNGYMIEKFEKTPKKIESRLHFSKTFQK